MVQHFSKQIELLPSQTGHALPDDDVLVEKLDLETIATYLGTIRGRKTTTAKTPTKSTLPTRI